MLKDNLKKHFNFEEQRICNVQHYNCVDHKQKHYKFWVVMEDVKVPVNCEEINWAKNWLPQHIKNTDHQVFPQTSLIMSLIMCVLNIFMNKYLYFFLIRLLHLT